MVRICEQWAGIRRFGSASNVNLGKIKLSAFTRHYSQEFECHLMAGGHSEFNGCKMPALKTEFRQMQNIFLY